MRSKIIKIFVCLIFVTGSLLARQVENRKGICDLPVKPLSKHVQQVIDDCCKRMHIYSRPIVMECPELLRKKNYRGVTFGDRIDLDSKIVKALEQKNILFSFLHTKNVTKIRENRVCALHTVYHELAHFKYHAVRERTMMEHREVSDEQELLNKARKVYCCMDFDLDRAKIQKAINECEQFCVEVDSAKKSILCRKIMKVVQFFKKEILDAKDVLPYVKKTKLKKFKHYLDSLCEKIREQDGPREEFEADAIACDALGCYRCVEIVRYEGAQPDISKGYFDREAYSDMISILKAEGKLCDHHRAMQ